MEASSPTPELLALFEVFFIQYSDYCFPYLNFPMVLLIFPSIQVHTLKNKTGQNKQKLK